MRIAVNARMLLKKRMEGIGRYIHETSSRMVKEHPEDEFIFFFDRNFHPSFVYGKNVEPVVLSPPTRDPLLWKIWFDYIIPRALKKYNADVFYTGDGFVSLRTIVPTVMVSHDLAYRYFPNHLPTRVLKYYQKYVPEFHTKADHIIAVSEFTKKDIINAFSIPPTKISVAKNAVPAGFSPIDDKEKALVQKEFTQGKPFILYLGAIHPRKNIINLVKAFEKFKANNHTHKLVLLGRKAWKYHELNNLIEQSSFKKDIVYIDGTTHDPKSILPAADILCYVSLFEGFGIPILEAMSAHVPVITSNVSSMPEVAGDAAILANPRDPTEIAQKIEDLISNKELCHQLITKGKERVDQFTWTNSSERIYNALKKVTL